MSILAKTLIGTVALGTVGYGIKKCVKIDSCSDILPECVNDAIYNGAESLLGAMDRVEQKVSWLGDYESSTLENEIKLEVSKKTDEGIDDFKNLYKLKLETYDKLEEYMIELLNKDNIKKDKTKNIEITYDMKDTLHNYMYLLKSLTRKCKDTTNKAEYLKAIEGLCGTKIIKKGKFNEKSVEMVLQAVRVLSGEQAVPMYVDLSSELD